VNEGVGEGLVTDDAASVQVITPSATSQVAGEPSSLRQLVRSAPSKRMTAFSGGV